MPSLGDELTTSSVIVADKVDVLQAAIPPEKQRENPYTFGQMKITPSETNKFAKTDDLNIVFWIYGEQLDPGDEEAERHGRLQLQPEDCVGREVLQQDRSPGAERDHVAAAVRSGGRTSAAGQPAGAARQLPGRRLPPRDQGGRQGIGQVDDARCDVHGRAAGAIRPAFRRPIGAVEMRIPQVRAMKTLSGLIVVAVVVGLAGEARPAFAAGPDGQLPAYSAHSTGVRALPGGTIVAFVRDGNGRPVVDAIVTAVGKRIATGVTDKTGRCDLSSLPAGDYLVRVHRAGYLPARSLVVLATPGVGTTWSFLLKPQPAAFLEPINDDPVDLRSRHRRRRAGAASRAVVGLGRRRRPRRGRVAHSSPEAQRAAGRNRAGDRRRDGGRRLRSRPPRTHSIAGARPTP